VRGYAYTLVLLVALATLATIGYAGHPDRCSGCHYNFYYTDTTKSGDLVADVAQTNWWNHSIYTAKAWIACEHCHTGIADGVSKSVHARIGCACHAVIHAPKFNANVGPWYAWVATTFISFAYSVGDYPWGRVERVEGTGTTLPAYKPTIPAERGTGFGVGIQDLVRVLLRLPAGTPTNYPKVNPATGEVTDFYRLREYFNLTDSFDGGDYPTGSGMMSYGVEVQLLTFRYKPTYNWTFIGGSWYRGWATAGPTTGGPVILTLGTKAVTPAAVGPYSGYAHPHREAWLVCYNCHFVTASVAAAGALRFIEGFWLIGIPEAALKLPAHEVTREATLAALTPEVKPVTLDIAPIAQAITLLLVTVAGIATIWISRRVS